MNIKTRINLISNYNRYLGNAVRTHSARSTAHVTFGLSHSSFMSLSIFFAFSNIEGMKPSMTFESSLSSCIGRNSEKRSSKASSPIPPCWCPSMSSTPTTTLYRIANPRAIMALVVSMVACEIPSPSMMDTSKRKIGEASSDDGLLASRTVPKIDVNAVRSTAPFSSANRCMALSTVSVVLCSNPGKVFTAFSTFGRASRIAWSRSGVVGTISSVSSSIEIVASGLGRAVTFVKESRAFDFTLLVLVLVIPCSSLLLSATSLASELGGKMAVPKSKPPANCTHVRASVDFGRSVSTGEMTTGIQFCCLSSFSLLLFVTNIDTKPSSGSTENPEIPD
mmetsp:Transcript_554/g.1205  ORF Transcript_554/g.1205 Transcript_554/m.1205 type:complete len:336 (-) Transcript_554:394-1401(-)